MIHYPHNDLKTLFSDEFNPFMQEDFLLYQSALNSNPENYVSMLTLGRAYTINGDELNALYYYMKALSHSNFSPEIAAHIGIDIANNFNVNLGLDIISKYCIDNSYFLHRNNFFEAAAIRDNKLKKIIKLENNQIKLLGIKSIINQNPDYNDNFEINSNGKYIFVNSIIRSGSQFLLYNLCNITKMPALRMQIGTFDRQYLIDHAVNIFSQGGCIVRHHVHPSKDNLNILHKYGINKIHLHVRDPREVLISRYYQIYNEMPGANNLRRTTCNVPNFYDNLSEDEKLLWCWSFFYPKFVNWIKDWINIYEKDSRFEFQFSDYANLKKNSTTLINDILIFFNIDVYDKKFEISKPMKKLHYRKNNPSEWRNKLSPEIKQSMWSAIPKEISNYFGWEK